jgi:hypothetical protein
MSYATETVMQLCHGKRRCQLSADTATFGDPCSENSRMYLKVVYTCGKYISIYTTSLSLFPLGLKGETLLFHDWA